MATGPGFPTRVLALSILVVTVSTLPVMLLGAAFIEIGPELGFGVVGLGVLSGTYFLTSAISSAPLGRVVARIGWTKAMRVNVAASGVCVLALAAARTLTQYVVLLIVSAAVYGFANPAANTALADSTDPRRRASMFGLKHAGIPLSTLLAGLAVPALVVTVGWRWAYVAAAGLALVIIWFIPRTPPAPATFTSAPDPRTTVRTMRTGDLVTMAAVSVFATFGPTALSAYLVAAAVDLGFSPSAAGLLLFAGSAASIGARLGAGLLTDRIGGRGFNGMATLTAVGAAVFVALAVASGASFAALAIAAFATGWGWPGLMTYAVVNANRGTVAASSSITQAGIFLGAGLGPVVIGWGVARYGFGAAWLIAAAGGAVSAIGVSLVGAHVSRGAVSAPSPPAPSART